MRSSRQVSVAAVLAALVASGTAHAQEDRSAQALARAQALLRQVSAQKQELEAANVRLTAEVNALQGKLAVAESGLRKTSASLAQEQRTAQRAGGELESTRSQLTDAGEKLRETKAELRSTSISLQEAQRQVAGLEGRLAEMESRLADSESKNLKLYEFNGELLELYRDKGVWTALLQHEPSGLKDAQIESILEEYQVKLEDSLTDDNRDALRLREPGAPAEAP